MAEYQVVEAFRGGPDLVKIVGHRGARGYFPENSHAGFIETINMGVTLLEFDVVFTSDGVPVITHDHYLHAPTFRGPDRAFVNTQIKVSDLTWIQLQDYEIGVMDQESRYAKRFPAQRQIADARVPRLVDLLALAADRQHDDVCLMLEIKSDPDFRSDLGYRRDMVATIIDQLRRFGLAQRTLLHSFDWEILTECQRQASDIATSFLTELPQLSASSNDPTALISPDFSGRKRQIPDLVHDAGGQLWCPYFRDVTRRDLQRAKDLGLVIAVWTVNEFKDIDKMISLSVDAIVTDFPDRVQSVLEDRGYNWRTQS